MSETISAFPLQWPIGWKRVAPSERRGGRFSKARDYSGPSHKVSVSDAVERVRRELDRMRIGDWNIVISTNVALRMDGFPRSDQREPDDPGAAVYWRESDGAKRVMAIDQYIRVADNLAAIAATLDAMRAIERHGGAVVLERAFTGFTALPAPIVAGMARPWREVLLMVDSRHATDPAQIREAYRRLAMDAHPDRGGSDRRMAELNRARDEALEELKT